MKTVDKLFEDFKIGNPLSDIELEVLEKKLEYIQNGLKELHCPDYYLVVKDIYTELDRVKSFIKARKE